jgi:DNA polymerase-3 subunit gamma/tau
MAQALYRKYRSKTLDEVVGQSHVTRVLSRALKQDKISHAYLLTGPRGVGKTTIARILAHEINQLPYDETTPHLDIIEIDAASNNGVDDVRALREKVQIAPVSARKKVYIIDEVHMLSKPAFNALLKTLEEPPEHVVFILATTDIHKVPDTILSRTQRFTFRSISTADAAAHLKDIAKKEKIAIDDEALTLIAEHGGGSFRDSISLLDQLSGLSDTKQPITAELVEQVIGRAPKNAIDQLIEAYKTQDQAAIITTLGEFETSGIDASIITNQLVAATKQRVAAEPQLIPLLERLLEVYRSARPDVKLITTLLAPSAKETKHVALVAAPAPELKVLEEEAIRPKPSEKHVAKQVKAAAAAPKEASSTPTATEAPVVESPAPKPKKRTGDAVPFEWDTYVPHFKGPHIALYSILTKCKYELDGDTLTLYTGTAFWKKKLDDPKYQPLLHQALEELNMQELDIETVPTNPPLKDSQAASVAAIMGGGEEVSLEEDS